MGTPDYMAPEQVRGSRGDQRTDIYSLGAILYEMATGETPFGGDSAYVIMNARSHGRPGAPRKLNPKLTPVLEEIILHAMERDPKRRYQSAGEMKAELDDYEKVQMTDRYTRLQAPQVWKSRFRMLPLIVGIVLLQVGVVPDPSVGTSENASSYSPFGVGGFWPRWLIEARLSIGIQKAWRYSMHV